MSESKVSINFYQDKTLYKIKYYFKKNIDLSIQRIEDEVIFNNPDKEIKRSAKITNEKGKHKIGLLKAKIACAEKLRELKDNYKKIKLDDDFEKNDALWCSETKKYENIKQLILTSMKNEIKKDDEKQIEYCLYLMRVIHLSLPHFYSYFEHLINKIIIKQPTKYGFKKLDNSNSLQADNTNDWYQFHEYIRKIRSDDLIFNEIMYKNLKEQLKTKLDNCKNKNIIFNRNFLIIKYLYYFINNVRFFHLMLEKFIIICEKKQKWEKIKKINDFVKPSYKEQYGFKKLIKIRNAIEHKNLIQESGKSLLIQLFNDSFLHGGSEYEYLEYKKDNFVSVPSGSSFNIWVRTISPDETFIIENINPKNGRYSGVFTSYSNTEGIHLITLVKNVLLETFLNLCSFYKKIQNAEDTFWKDLF